MSALITSAGLCLLIALTVLIGSSIVANEKRTEAQALGLRAAYTTAAVLISYFAGGLL